MPDISIRPLREADLAEAGRIVPLAFGTFLGHPPPAPEEAAEASATTPDTDYVRTRWLADPSAAFVAELDGALVGSVFAVHWGSVGFFGPLTVHPNYWDQSIGQRLLRPVMERFASWGVTHAGLFTFAQSPKHLHLYQRFDFWPRFLTAIMSKPVAATDPVSGWSRFSALPASEQEACLATCRALTGAIYPGLDVALDIRAVQMQHLGDTVLLWDDDGSQLVGFAVCHFGPGTEAGHGKCYVKFGAIHPGPNAPREFERLLRACETLAAAEGLISLEAGVNLGRHEAYRALLARGWRADFQGVAMHRPNEPGYHHPGVYVIDDWR
ncbi:MAG TPA: GNAT family N-acetyltransferase [Ktedonobacterales bacterium]|nr:GNAT family N-acetyltransferase [Ktedonobacterales bacterium]